MAFEHATPAYLAALEDKGLFGAGTAGGGRRGSIGAAPTVPVWMQLQTTKYAHIWGWGSGCREGELCCLGSASLALKILIYNLTPPPPHTHTHTHAHTQTPTLFPLRSFDRQLWCHCPGRVEGTHRHTRRRPRPRASHRGEVRADPHSLL